MNNPINPKTLLHRLAELEPDFCTEDPGVGCHWLQMEPGAKLAVNTLLQNHQDRANLTYGLLWAIDQKAKECLNLRNSQVFGGWTVEINTLAGSFQDSNPRICLALLQAYVKMLEAP